LAFIVRITGSLDVAYSARALDAFDAAGEIQANA
jgi:hypothetical protein